MALARSITRWTLVLAVIVAAGIAALWTASRPAQPDAFYDSPAPRSGDPGALLRSEPYTKQLPAGAQGWRILYTATRGDSPAVASAIVVTSARTTNTPRPLIAWAQGTTNSGATESAQPWGDAVAEV